MAMLAYAEEMILRFPNAKAMIFIKWTKKIDDNLLLFCQMNALWHLPAFRPVKLAKNLNIIE